MWVRRLAAASASLCCILLVAGPAHSQENCSRVIVFTLPGVTWEEVDRAQPPVLMRLARDSATGSMSVRTNSARTTYASGFATIGAGTRVDGGVTTGGLATSRPSDGFVTGTVGGIGEIHALAEEDGYAAVPGALAESLGDIPAIAIGDANPWWEVDVPERPASWPVLAAMDPRGHVDLAKVGPDLIDPGPDDRNVTDDAEIAAAVRSALELGCAVTVIDHGDLIRSEVLAGPGGPSMEEREQALLASDSLLGEVVDELGEDDLLLVVSPTSPLAEVHLGVAIANGPGFAAGSGLSSASTRRDGIVTLPDIAPTILEHLGIDRHPAMLGRPFFSTAGSADRVADAIETDREAVFVDGVRAPVTTVFVVAQVVLYLVVAWLLTKRRSHTGGLTRGLEGAALAVVAFPLCTYLAGFLSQHELGPWGYAALLAGLVVALVISVMISVERSLDRLLALTGLTCAVLLIDALVGTPLQVNTAFSYSPLVAGRFAGFGNTAFSVLGAATVITATLIVHRGRGDRRSLVQAALLFAVVIVIDGGPAWGSDVGGVLAFVPAFGLTWVLLARKRPSLKLILICAGAAIAALGLFLAVDMARAPESRTHLARLFEDVRARGIGAFGDAVGRKIETNLRVFTSTIWTYLVPPALAFLAWLLLRPQKRWERLAVEYPILRAGLIGGLILSVLGFLVNDSGIVVPAVILGFLAPVAMLIHLLLEPADS